MTNENNLKLEDAIENARCMYHDLSSLKKIMRYNGERDDRIELSVYLEKMTNAKSRATKAKWYSKIISIFHAASGILHNGKNVYHCMVADIDMEDLKAYLKERAMDLLSEKNFLTEWSRRVRTATLKRLDLEELI